MFVREVSALLDRTERDDSRRRLCLRMPCYLQSPDFLGIFQMLPQSPKVFFGKLPMNFRVEADHQHGLGFEFRRVCNRSPVC
jgi:hypothetical protein